MVLHINSSQSFFFYELALKLINWLAVNVETEISVSLKIKPDELFLNPHQNFIIFCKQFFFVFFSLIALSEFIPMGAWILRKTMLNYAFWFIIYINNTRMNKYLPISPVKALKQRLKGWG